MNNNNKNNISSTEVPMFYTASPITELVTKIKQEIIEELLPYISNMANTPDPEALLTRKEAAKEFKSSIATIDNYRRRGWISPCRIGGKVFYTRKAMQAAFSGNILNPYKVPKNGKK